MLAHSAYLEIPGAQGNTIHLRDWPLPHQSIEKNPSDTPTGPSDGGNASVEILFFITTPVCVELMKPVVV